MKNLTILLVFLLFVVIFSSCTLSKKVVAKKDDFNSSITLVDNDDVVINLNRNGSIHVIEKHNDAYFKYETYQMKEVGEIYNVPLEQIYAHIKK
jgi:hypothetical protein